MFNDLRDRAMVMVKLAIVVAYVGFVVGAGVGILTYSYRFGKALFV